ncbi:hypothetical protein ACIQOV_35960 [Kitasatospora sp. NPDC091257]|uniref:hypothetical protein n=1 Tax=unclassified Kitasatospora TaxID=2633591 RepID=UPI002F90F370
MTTQMAYQTDQLTEGGAEPLRTEFEFDLPMGYVDQAGRVHRNGAMRLATARDELSPLMDQRVRENPAYLGVVLLSLVITRLGEVRHVSAEVVEQLFAADVAYLQRFYEQINAVDPEGPGAGERLGES